MEEFLRQNVEGHQMNVDENANTEQKMLFLLAKIHQYEYHYHATQHFHSSDLSPKVVQEN